MKETYPLIQMSVWPPVKFSEKTNWRLWVIWLKPKGWHYAYGVPQQLFLSPLFPISLPSHELVLVQSEFIQKLICKSLLYLCYVMSVVTKLCLHVGVHWYV